MKKGVHPAAARQRAVSACLKKFDERALSFGKADCVRLAALALRKQGVAIPLLKGVQYRTRVGAMKALAASGFSDLCAAVDALGLARIAPASAWPGDLIAMPTPDGDPFGASLMVVHTAGARRVIGLDGHGVFRVVAPDLSCCLAAWRVDHG
ncbi:MAG: hypothetical protein ABL308_12660 [Oceanicaulis sp.]